MKIWKNRLPRVVLAVSLGFLIQGQAMASAIKLVDILVNETGLSESLSKHGIRGTSATKVKSYVRNSVSSLYLYGNKKPTASQLKRFVRGIKATGKDARYKSDLLKLLNKSEKKMSQKDLVTAINSLIYLANRHGKSSSAILACAACVSDSLSKKGFKFTLETMNNKQSKKVLSKMLPSNPRSLTNYINAKLGKFQIGSLSGSGKLVAAEEEKALGLFLGLKDVGSKQQKSLIGAIENLSKDSSGKVNIINPQNPHKLWKLFSEDISESEMSGWTSLLDEVAKKSKGKTNKKEVFFEILEGRAAGKTDLQDRVQSLKNKNCFFK
ncbi:hypothetical protein A9Q84_13555 [Halobacteriovorax marinus]|uniref:Uncharacterized protein n=1 Tax=Halobacteriovorax marinus TaxID=97084 RepID=A0A1Y5F995_9BACT|nr:hypothetical protein A9Q84_13555 [Halobacteriovorax marinus]